MVGNGYKSHPPQMLLRYFADTMKTIVVLALLVASALAGFEENRGIEDVDLFEGDMILTADQRAELETRGERASINYRLWPNAQIVYDVEPSIANEPRAMARLNEAIAEYHQKTCIRFKKRTTETAYVSVFKGGGCWSYVGRTGSKQQLSLAGGCWYKGIVVHEFGHALGFFHEQSRPDRDNFVTIKFENIQTGKESNFRKHSSGIDSQGTTYDYGSIMHYGSRAFTKNGQPTIVPKKTGVTIGQRRGLSPIDTIQLNKMYKCGNIPTQPPPVTSAPGGLACDFERDTCGFSQSTSDKFDWTRRQGTTPSGGTGPTGDHTTGSGYYMYIETSSPRVKGDNAVLEKQVSLSGNDCLKFFYQMNGGDVGTLNVYVGNTKVFTKSGSQGQPWKAAEVLLSQSGSQKIRFEGIRGSSWQGDIAIDDVKLTKCGGVQPTPPPPPPPSTPPPPPPPSTPAPPGPSGFKCNFESDCGFTQRKDDKFDWTRRKLSTPSSNTGPSGDHTTGKGYYMYIETSYPRVNGDNAIIEKSVSIGSNQCLTFYYHMYGFHIGTLNVFVGASKVFTKSGPQGNKWIKASVPLSRSGSQKLSFEGIRAKEYSGDIAIDDISIGSCGSVPTPPPPTQPPTPPVVTGTAAPPGSCGVRPNTRIVGGTAAKHGDWPWQVQLRTTSGFPYCGGSLIHPQWILTATHCVRGKSPSSIVIRLGAHRRVNTVGTEQDIKVSKVITHPSYHKPKSYSHDIALLKLAKPALLNRNVNLVCLPETDPAPTDGKHCWITGWGRLSSGGATPDYLQQVSVPIASRARCDKAYPNKIHDSMICAGIDQGGIDSCQGDSGGPMVCENGGRFYIHGATSWGYGCAAPGKFGVYAKVKYLLPWIKGEMAKN